MDNYRVPVPCFSRIIKRYSDPGCNLAEVLAVESVQGYIQRGGRSGLRWYRRRGRRSRGRRSRIMQGKEGDTPRKLSEWKKSDFDAIAHHCLFVQLFTDKRLCERNPIGLRLVQVLSKLREGTPLKNNSIQVACLGETPQIVNKLGIAMPI